MIGALSGQKPGAFSVTINTRFYPGGIMQLFDQAIFALENKGTPIYVWINSLIITPLQKQCQLVS